MYSNTSQKNMFLTLVVNDMIIVMKEVFSVVDSDTFCLQNSWGFEMTINFIFYDIIHTRTHTRDM